MRKRLSFFLFLLGCLPLMAQQQTTNLPIGNDWTGVGFQVLPDGNILAGYGGTFTQDTHYKASDLQRLPNGEYGNGLYVMTFSAKNYLFSYPGYYEAKLSLGDHELCKAEGWGIGPWAKATLVCPTSNYLVEYGWPVGQFTTADLNAHILISFSGNGWPLLFQGKSISLTFMPE